MYLLSFVTNLLNPWTQDHTSEESDGWGQRQIARLPDCQVETFELQLFGNFGHICGPLVLQLFHIPMMMMDNVGDGDGDDKSHLLFYSHLSLPWNVFFLFLRLAGLPLARNHRNGSFKVFKDLYKNISSRLIFKVFMVFIIFMFFKDLYKKNISSWADQFPLGSIIDRYEIFLKLTMLP